MKLHPETDWRSELSANGTIQIHTNCLFPNQSTHHEQNNQHNEIHYNGDNV